MKTIKPNKGCKTLLGIGSPLKFTQNDEHKLMDIELRLHRLEEYPTICPVCKSDYWDKPRKNKIKKEVIKR